MLTATRRSLIPPSKKPGPVKGPAAPQLPALRPSTLRMPVTRGPLVDRARRMRRTATGLLVLMAAVFIVISLQFEGSHPAWGYAIAFAEAAMVGGLADWFAVTALFRHPLGIPIPH